MPKEEFIPKPIMKTIRGKRLVIFPGTGVFEIDHMKEGQEKKKSEKAEKVLNDIKKNTKKAAKASGGKGGGGSSSGAFAKSLSGAGARAVKDAISPIVDAVNPMTYINLLGDLPVISELKDAAKAANEASKANKESRDEEKKEKPTTEPRKEQKEETEKTREQELTENNLEIAREEAKSQEGLPKQILSLNKTTESIENIVGSLLAIAKGDKFDKREKEVEGLRKKKPIIDKSVATDGKKEGGGMFAAAWPWLGGLLGGGLGGMLGGIIGGLGGMVAAMVGLVGPIILGVLAVGAGAAVGTWIYNNWVKKWQDEFYERMRRAESLISGRTFEQSTIIDESTEKEEGAYYTPEGHAAQGKRPVISTTEARAYAKEKGMTLEELEKEGGINKAMAQLGVHGEEVGGSTLKFGTVAETEEREAQRKINELDEKGRNAALSTISQRLKDESGILMALMSLPVTNVKDANAQANAILDTIKSIWNQADEFRRDGKISEEEFKSLEKGFPLAAYRYSSPVPNKSKWTPSATEEEMILQSVHLGEIFGGGTWNFEDLKQEYGAKGHNYTPSFQHGGMGKFGKATPVIMHGDEIVFSMSDLAKGKGLGTLDAVGKSLVMGLASMSSGVGIGASDTTSGGLLAGANGALANNKMNGGGGGGMLVNSPNTTNNTTTNNNISQGRGDSRMDESAFNIERYRLANRGMF